MRIVIDTNIIISALIKDSLARLLILFGNLDLVSPEFTMDEVNKYKGIILDKSALSEEEFKELFLVILGRIEMISKFEYESYIKEAEEIIGAIDIKDVPFVACALVINSDGIWSEDRHFERQDRIRVFKTIDVLKIVGE